MSGLSDQSLQHAGSIQETTELQLGKMREVVAAIEGVVVIAEETATGTDQVAVSASELSTGMTGFHQKLTALNNLSDQLQDHLNRFKLEENQRNL